jgi:starvation-inducible DNA-binding protein
MSLHTTLEETFASNFVVYYKAHVAHVNITGANFYSDHKLLQKVYEHLQDNIDALAEKLRTIRAVMPDSLSSVVALSPIADGPTYGDRDELLTDVYDSVESLIDQYHSLYTSAEEEGVIDISNFAQDEIGQLTKLCWMLRATLNDSYE